MADEQTQVAVDQAEAQAAQQAAELAAKGIDPEQVKKLVDAGLVIPKPNSVDDLPKELRNQVDDLIKGKSKEEAQKIKDQLYDSMEHYKNRLQEVESVLQKQKEDRETLEKTEQEKLEKERKEKLTLSQKLEEAQRESEERLNSIQEQMSNKVKELERQLNKERLTSVREKAKAEFKGQLVESLILDPEKNPDATEEDLIKSIEIAHQEFKRIVEPYEQQLQQISSQEVVEEQPRTLDLLRAKFKGGGRDSNISGYDSGNLTQKIKSARSVDDLQPLLESTLKKYGM